MKTVVFLQCLILGALMFVIFGLEDDLIRARAYTDNLRESDLQQTKTLVTLSDAMKRYCLPPTEEVPEPVPGPSNLGPLDWRTGVDL